MRKAHSLSNKTYKHKYRNQHAVLHELYTWSLEETWSKVSGDEVDALSPKIFCHPLQNMKFGGGGCIYSGFRGF